ncbi:MAG: hypothetical protein AB8G14_17470 [Ilumatobacter sp.]
MQTPGDHPMLALADQWAAHLGYYDNAIDLAVDDLSAFTTPESAMTAHAPLWGVKEGAEEAVPVAEVRRRLSRMLRFGRPVRHDMHLAIHRDGTELALFFRLKLRVRFIPITFRTIPLVLLFQATDVGNGLRIAEVHEWAAADPAATCRLLVERHDWPADTSMHPHVAFGAMS